MREKKEKNKISLRQKFSYWFDNVMSRGTVSMVLILFLITLVVVVTAGILSVLLKADGSHSIGESIWVSLMHAIDAGTITGHTGSFVYMLLMTLVTICGLFITSVLIGIINTGMHNKMESLRKGKSKVLSSGHTIILGAGPSTFTILSELIASCPNGEKNTVVIMDEGMEKEELEDAIRRRIHNTGSTKIICRSGKITDPTELKICSPEFAKSVIVNSNDDFQTIKAILAVTSILKESDNTDTYITAVISEKENYDAAIIAGEDRAEVLFFEDTIARIAANTCRQPGISAVYTELFSFEGSEIYLESAEGTEGLSVAEMNLRLPNTSVLGIEKKGRIILNPHEGLKADRNDRLVILSGSRGLERPEKKPAVPDMTAINKKEENRACSTQKMLILGYSPRIEKILIEEDKYMAAGSEIFIAIQEEYRGMLPEPVQKYKNIKVSCSFCNIYSRAVLKELLKCVPGSVFVSSSLMEDEATDDSKTLLLLLQLRSIADEMNISFSVTSEMRVVENQKLAQITEVKDFVISSNITSLMLTQISQERELRKIFRELLSDKGAEIYMRPASDYVTEGRKISIYTASAAAAIKNQILIGYSKMYEDGKWFDIKLNPEKNSELSFTAADRFIVIADK